VRLLATRLRRLPEPERSVENKMNLSQVIHNPEMLKAFYSESPSLDRITLHRLTLDRNSLTISFDVLDFPDKKPKKWHPDFNTAQITITFWGINNKIDIKGFCDIIQGKLIINKHSEIMIDFEFEGSDVKIQGSCQVVRLEKIEGYINTELNSIQPTSAPPVG